MRLKFAAAIAFAWCSSAMANPYVDVQDPGPRYRLNFPAISLASGQGERIVSLDVTVRCGFLAGVSSIPADWSITVRGPISGEATLVAKAGHGASWLWTLRTWNGLISVRPYDMSCFDMSARVVTSGVDSDQSKEITFGRHQLRLSRQRLTRLPLPRPS